MAPHVQVGYFDKFDGTEWLWGGKVTYSYTNVSSQTRAFDVPQYGSFGSTPFVGNAIVRSYQTNLNNQFVFLPYLGRAFEAGYIYLGGGPTLSQISTYMKDVIGFADINGVHTDISGAAQSFSNNRWVWGGAVSLGGTYFITENLFLDLSYTYTVTANYSQNYFSTFSNPAGTVYNPSNRNYTGTLTGLSGGYISSNNFGLTLNVAF